jgi:hypothetical protein
MPQPQPGEKHPAGQPTPPEPLWPASDESAEHEAPTTRREGGADDQDPPASPPRQPTLQLPVDEWEPPEWRTPVDPWADADPFAPPLPPYPSVSHPPTRPYPSGPAESPPLTPTRPYPSAPTGPPATPPTLTPQPASSPPAQLPVPRSPAGPPPPLPPPAGKPSKRRRDRRPDPAAPPPGWQAPPGYVPVAVRRRWRWPRIVTWLTLLTVACCCGCPGYFGKPMWEQYPASVSVRAEVADLTLRDDAKSQQTARRLEQETRSAHLLVEKTFAAVYGDPTGKRVTIFGTTGFRLDPKGDLDTEMARLTKSYALTEVTPIETGVRGEHQQCGVGEVDGTDVVVCGWADHGSLAAALFTRRSVPDSAALLGEIRTALVARG